MPQIPEDLDEQAESDEAIFLECAERLRIAEEAEAQNRLLAIEDMEFADGQQWPDDLYNMRKVQRRPSLTINHTGMLVRRVINNMAEQRPRIKAHPLGDGAQIDDAKAAQGLVRHVENLSQADVAYDTAGESAVRAGWGYVRILGEYIDERSFDQELRIKPVRNALTGYIDPAAEMPDGSDMEWFIFSDKMSRQDFKRRYPDEQLIDWSHGAAGDNQKQWLTKTQIRIAEYYRIKKTKDTLYQLTDGRKVLGSEMRGKWEAFENAGLTVVQKRPTERRQVQWFRINGVKIVDRRDLPGKWIPVARCEGNVLDINGDVRRKGMVRDLKDPQRMFNYWETAKTEKLALSSKAPWVAAEDQLDGHPEWDDANQKPYSVLKYKLVRDAEGNPVPVPPPQRMAAVEVEAGFAEAAESAGKNLMMVAGMPHEPGQDTPGTVVSGLALRRRQQISDISHVQYYNKQTMMIAHVGRILLDLFPYYYGTQRMQRIIGDDGVPEMVALNQPQPTPTPGVMAIKYDMNVGRYDVVMDTGPGYETKRLEGAENMIDLLKTPLGEPVVKAASDIVMRNFDFNGAQDIADRLAPMTPQGMDKAMKALPKQAQGIVQGLQQQLQQAQQLIQHLQLEIKYKGGIEQMKQQGETQRTRMELATKVHDTNTRAETAREDTHVKAHTSIAVAEIHEAGQMLNTHVEATHNKELARQTAEAAQRAEKRDSAE